MESKSFIDQLNLQKKKRGVLLFIAALLLISGLPFKQAIAQKTGSKSSLKIERYIDFQCPPCRKHFFMMRELKKEYGDKINIISLHYPLKGHPYAPVAARASEAARKQGKFHGMALLLYQNQSKWAVPAVKKKLIEYAVQLNLDIEQFKQDLNATGIYKKVTNQKMEGRHRGVYATPSIFIENEKIDLPDNLDEFRKTVDAHLSKK